jgi:hypothetical protein
MTGHTRGPSTGWIVFWCRFLTPQLKLRRAQTGSNRLKLGIKFVNRPQTVNWAQNYGGRPCFKIYGVPCLGIASCAPSPSLLPPSQTPARKPSGQSRHPNFPDCAAPARLRPVYDGLCGRGLFAFLVPCQDLHNAKPVAVPAADLTFTEHSTFSTGRHLTSDDHHCSTDTHMNCTCPSTVHFRPAPQPDLHRV